MRHIAQVPALLIALSGSAQITITQVDLPDAGDTMRYRTTTAFDVDLGLTGAGTIWDLGMLEPLLPGADTAVTVASTPLLYQFFFNNAILYPAHDADHAMKGAAFGFQQLEVENVYDYYKKGASAFENVGFGATINGLPASVRRIPVDRIYELPLAYGNTDASPSAFELEVPGMLYFAQQQQRNTEVDGWGTLYLPTDTFEVLRVRTELDRHDSIYVDQFGFGFGFDEPQTVEYKWLANGMDAPVLIVTTVGGVPTTARFYYDPNAVTTSVAATGQAAVPTLFPNPVHGLAMLTVPAAGPVRVCDALGRTVQDLGFLPAGVRREIDATGWVAGAYVVQGGNAEAPWSLKLIVE